MNFGLYMGLISLISVVVLICFSYQDWYIDWLQKRVLVDKNKIKIVDLRIGRTFIKSVDLNLKNSFLKK